MPIHEYSCEACGHRFEKLVRRAAPSAAVAEALSCPRCASAELHQEYSSFAAAVGAPAKSQPAMAGSCPSGMCRTPGLCGRN